MRDVLDNVQADVEAARKRREAARAIDPSLTAVMDELGSHARMRCIWKDGQVVAGKPPPPDPPSWFTLSGDCVVALCKYGRKR